jgi:hypothetical protein
MPCRAALAGVLVLSAVTGGRAAGAGLQEFIARQRPTVGALYYARSLRLPPRIGSPLARAGVAARRPVVHVDNQHLDAYVDATRSGYLEVVIPAGKGHLYFRHGTEVFDFSDAGFRVGGVRPIKSDRYGILIPLSPSQEGRLSAYLERLKATDGAELGTYDFEGEKGFHCVSWMKQLRFDDAGHTLVDLLGGSPKKWDSMPQFAQFLLKRARGVESVVVYRDGATSPETLGEAPDVVSLRQLRRARPAP